MKGKYNKIIYALLGVLGAFVSAAAGYWLAAAINYVTVENIAFVQAVGRVMKAPFASYVNDYTLVVMLLTFVLFQSLFFLYLLLVHSRASKSGSVEEIQVEEQADANVSSAFLEGIIDTKNDTMNAPENIDFTMDYVFPANEPEAEYYPQSEQSDFAESYEPYEPEIDEPEADETEKEEVELFSSDVVMELLLQYDKDQIMEMKKLTKYIDNLTVAILKRMFKPNMAAEDIREYIEIFYGDKEV